MIDYIRDSEKKKKKKEKVGEEEKTVKKIGVEKLEHVRRSERGIVRRIMGRTMRKKKKIKETLILGFV